MKKLLLSFLIVCSAARVNAQACTGVPAANTAIASATNICVGMVMSLSLQNVYTQTGLVYQWVYSPNSANGPWTVINGATAASLMSTTLTQSAWYTCSVQCSNSALSTTATPIYINIMASGATTTVPYYENFESLGPNGMPNCSWISNGTNTVSLTMPSPVAVACGGLGRLGFEYPPTQPLTSEFFSQGIIMSSALSYSIYVGQTTSNYFFANSWGAFGIGIGTTQAVASSTTIYLSNSPNSGVCALRSGTFTPPSNGIYYVRLFATAVASNSVVPYLTFDDLTITTPCNLGNNSASVQISPNPISLCFGDSMLMTLTPDPNVIVSSPTVNPIYVKANSLQGVGMFTCQTTNTLSGCVQSKFVPLVVYANPTVSILTNKDKICQGDSSVIYSSGLQAFTLTPTGTFANSVMVTPTITTVYTASITNGFGCSGSNTLQIAVVPSPTLTLSTNSISLCSNESGTLQVSGANAYGVNGVPSGPIITLPPAVVSKVYTVTGITNGCRSSLTVTLTVEKCLGLSDQAADLDVNVVPNPIKNYFELSCNHAIRYKLISAEGRVLLEQVVEAGTTRVNVQDLTTGIYILQVQNGSQTKSLRLLKE